MTALDLDAIKLRRSRVVRGEARGGADYLADTIESAGDVPALVAEVERLQRVITDAQAHIAEHTHPDDWGVPCVYVERLLPILVGGKSSDSSSTGGEL